MLFRSLSLSLGGTDVCRGDAIMNGFGGAGAFSDGKYNITNQFGGTLHEYIGKKQAIELMNYVDQINLDYGGEGTALYSTANTKIKKLCVENDLHLLDASVRHLGTDINYIVLENLYNELKDKVEFHFETPVDTVENFSYNIHTKNNDRKINNRQANKKTTNKNNFVSKK